MRRLLFGLLFVIFSLLFATLQVEAGTRQEQPSPTGSGTFEQDPSPPVRDSPSITVPGTPTKYESSEQERDAAKAFEKMIQTIADARGMTFEAAKTMQHRDGVLQAWIESIKEDPGFADFKFVDGEKDADRHGIVALVRGRELDATAQRSADAWPVEFVEASFGWLEFALKREQLLDKIQRLDSSVLTVDYDAFEDVLEVVRQDGNGDLISRSSMDEALRSTFGRVPESLTILSDNVELSEEGSQPLNGDGGGGLKYYRAGNQLSFCTTGWGVSRTFPDGFYQTGWLSAGHCYNFLDPWTGQYNPNKDRVIPYWNDGHVKNLNANAIEFHRWSYYEDRVFMDDWAASASWWTRVDRPTYVQDMSSTVWNFWLGGNVCWYGETTRSMECGPIRHFGFTDSATGNGVGHMHMANADRLDANLSNPKCDHGDSGGPVYVPWSNGVSYPAGMISHKTDTASQIVQLTPWRGGCGFVELYWQLYGLPLVML